MALLIVAAVWMANFSPLADLFNQEQLSKWAEDFRQAWWSPIILIGLYGLTAFGVPAGPLIFAGSLFGALYGSVYNLTGLFLASMLSFVMAKHLGRDFVVHITGNRLRRTERYLQRFGFWPLVQTRFLPVPAAVVNFAAALAGVPMRLFLVAAFVGYLPSTVIHTYFIAELIATQGQEQIQAGALYLAAFSVFNIVIGWSWIAGQLQRRKRYRQLRVQRALRKPSNAQPPDIVQV